MAQILSFLGLFVFSVSGGATFAADPAPAPETFKVLCGVFEAGSTTQIANRALVLTESKEDLVYQDGSLTYTITYHHYNRGSVEYEYEVLALRLRDSSRGLNLTASSGTGRSWTHGVALESPYGLPRVNCVPSYPRRAS